MGETFLVTRGARFIGTWVLRELQSRGLKPVAFDVRPNDTCWQKLLRVDSAI